MNNHKSYLYKDVCEATLLQHEMPSVIPLLKETTLFHETFFFFFFTPTECQTSTFFHRDI